MKTTQYYEKKIITIPNILSLFRICLIPVFVWLYCVKKDYMMTGAVLVLSGLTDTVDGFVARHFHMISNLGKALDPIADKLTQAAMLCCLILEFPLMIVPFALLICKELFVGTTGLLVIRKTGQVHGANWHGKAATFLLYAMMILHVVWYEIPEGVSNVTIAVCIFVMALSLVLYGVRNIKLLLEARTT